MNNFTLPTPNTAPIDLATFAHKAQDRDTTKSVLLMRHSQRPPIAPDDPSFGNNLGLTERGAEMAKDAGAALRGLPDCVFGASPMRRTRETARHVATSAGYENADIFDVPEIGLNGLFIADPALLFEGYRNEGSVDFTNRYLRTGAAEGYVPVQEGAHEMTRQLTQTDFGGKHAVLTSHDIFIAALLRGLGVGDFDTDYWIGFLHGAGFLQNRSGAWDVYYCVPNLADYRSVFFQ